MFAGRDLVIATKHRKESVIAPILEQELGVHCFVPTDLDTDQLGTFSGEVERTDDPITTARKKCLMAMEQTHATLAIASEGSFGPHPSLFFVSVDEEFLFFMDRENDLEIIVREVSTDTNFNKKEICSREELDSFAQLIGFPSHGLIMNAKANDQQDMVKGIQDWHKLYHEFDQLMANSSSVHVETDMRAFCNPTRMKVIEKAAHKLVEKIKSVCPSCSTPGFSITDHLEGLPCSWCGSPTRSTLSHVYSCAKCSFTREEKYPNGKKEEDPMYCDRCNP